VADRWIGHRNAVVIGALARRMGHIAMVLEQSFLAALSLLIVGSGFLKGNISVQPGGRAVTASSATESMSVRCYARRARHRALRLSPSSRLCVSRSPKGKLHNDERCGFFYQ